MRHGLLAIRLARLCRRRIIFAKCLPQNPDSNTMKLLQLIPLLAILCLASCAGQGINVFGKTVTVVNDRNADGSIRPVKEVLDPVDGQVPIGAGRIYVYPDGDVAVSGDLTNPLTGQPLLLKH